MANSCCTNEAVPMPYNSNIPMSAPPSPSSRASVVHLRAAMHAISTTPHTNRLTLRASELIDAMRSSAATMRWKLGAEAAVLRDPHTVDVLLHTTKSEGGVSTHTPSTVAMPLEGPLLTILTHAVHPIDVGLHPAGHALLLHEDTATTVCRFIDELLLDHTEHHPGCLLVASSVLRQVLSRMCALLEAWSDSGTVWCGGISVSSSLHLWSVGLDGFGLDVVGAELATGILRGRATSASLLQAAEGPPSTTAPQRGGSLHCSSSDSSHSSSLVFVPRLRHLGVQVMTAALRDDTGPINPTRCHNSGLNSNSNNDESVQGGAAAGTPPAACPSGRLPLFEHLSCRLSAVLLSPVSSWLLSPQLRLATLMDDHLGEGSCSAAVARLCTVATVEDDMWSVGVTVFQLMMQRAWRLTKGDLQLQEQQREATTRGETCSRCWMVSYEQWAGRSAKGDGNSSRSSSSSKANRRRVVVDMGLEIEEGKAALQDWCDLMGLSSVEAGNGSPCMSTSMVSVVRRFRLLEYCRRELLNRLSCKRGTTRSTCAARGTADALPTSCSVGPLSATIQKKLADMTVSVVFEAFATAKGALEGDDDNDFAATVAWLCAALHPDTTARRQLVKFLVSHPDGLWDDAADVEGGQMASSSIESGERGDDGTAAPAAQTISDATSWFVAAAAKKWVANNGCTGPELVVSTSSVLPAAQQQQLTQRTPSEVTPTVLPTNHHIKCHPIVSAAKFVARHASHPANVLPLHLSPIARCMDSFARGGGATAAVDEGDLSPDGAVVDDGKCLHHWVPAYYAWKAVTERYGLQHSGGYVNAAVVRSNALFVGWLHLLWELSREEPYHDGGDETCTSSARRAAERIVSNVLQSFLLEASPTRNIPSHTAMISMDGVTMAKILLSRNPADTSRKVDQGLSRMGSQGSETDPREGNASWSGRGDLRPCTQLLGNAMGWFRYAPLWNSCTSSAPSALDGFSGGQHQQHHQNVLSPKAIKSKGRGKREAYDGGEDEDSVRDEAAARHYALTRNLLLKHMAVAPTITTVPRGAALLSDLLREAEARLMTASASNRVHQEHSTTATVWGRIRSLVTKSKGSLPLAHHRALTWRALLLSKSTLPASPSDALEAVGTVYAALPLHAPNGNDRQIAVDIPRCHQYDPGLASARGHRGIRNVVKAWLLTQPQLVYWQGADSVCAVLLSTSHYDEPLAFQLLTLVMDRWIPHFFVPAHVAAEHGGTMDQRLLILSLLLRFYDPCLALHLETIECKPELYAISWLLTLFAHVLPVERVRLVWDFLFASGHPHAVLSVACAGMMAFREALLDAQDFSAAVGVMSTLWQRVDIAVAIEDAAELLRSTPTSILRPDFTSSASEASLIRTSCCALLHSRDLAAVVETACCDDNEGDEEESAERTTRWGHSGGVVLLDMRTDEEVQVGLGRAQYILGAIRCPPQRLQNAGNTSGPGGADRDDHEGDSGEGPLQEDEVLRLLCKQRSMLVRPGRRDENYESLDVATTDAAGNMVQHSLGSSVSSSPLVALVVDQHPEDGQRAADQLCALGVPKVAMMLGGVRGGLALHAPNLLMTMPAMGSA